MLLINMSASCIASIIHGLINELRYNKSMETVIKLALTFIMAFVAMANTMAAVGFITGNMVAAAIVSLFVGSVAFVVVWVLGNKKTGLKF